MPKWIIYTYVPLKHVHSHCCWNKLQHSWYFKCCIIICANSIITLPKFNSSPLNSYQNPIGKACLPTIIFQGRAVKLQGGTLPETNIAHENPIFPCKYHRNGGFSMAMLVSGRVHTIHSSAKKMEQLFGSRQCPAVQPCATGWLGAWLMMSRWWWCLHDFTVEMFGCLTSCFIWFFYDLLFGAMVKLWKK